MLYGIFQQFISHGKMLLAFFAIPPFSVSERPESRISHIRYYPQHPNLIEVILMNIGSKKVCLPNIWLSGSFQMMKKPHEQCSYLLFSLKTTPLCKWANLYRFLSFPSELDLNEFFFHKIFLDGEKKCIILKPLGFEIVTFRMDLFSRKLFAISIDFLSEHETAIL